MAKTLNVPDLRVSGIYYPQLLDLLVAFKRENVPELTDESEFEPLMQMIRAYALVGHLSNTLLDVVGNECTLPTARIPQTIRDMLKLIGERLLPASPSEADLLLELTAPLTALTEIAPAGAQVATQNDGTHPAILFEIPEAVTIPRTDRVSFAFVESSAGVFTDVTAAVIASSGFPAFEGDVTPGTTVYVGVVDAMWNKMVVTLAAPTAPGVDGVWEFHDGNLDLANPDVVGVLGPNLEMTVNGLLGFSWPAPNRAGTVVRVRLAEGTAYEDCVVIFSGGFNAIVTTGLLGQTVASSVITDYVLGVEWRELALDSDGTVGLTQSGTIAFTLPQDAERDWTQSVVNAQTAFWLRFRIVDVPAAVEPTVNTITVTAGKQWAIVEVVQGRTQTETLGSSDGSLSQRFTASKGGYVDGTMEVAVDGVAWTAVENFLHSAPSDKHYLVELGDDDAAVVVFGDGVAGAIPATGANNVVGTFRFGVKDDGNVGAGTITSDRSGLSRVNRVSNPRAAAGWNAGEAASDAGLARAKLRAPASLRTKGVAVSAGDVEVLALAFEDVNGAVPFSRALAIEEGFGPKTIELVLVTAGGGQPTSDQLAAIEVYFNGDKTSSPPKPSRVVANQRVYARSFSPRSISVSATVQGSGFEVQEISDALALLLRPEALQLDENGAPTAMYEWDFGGEVPTSRLIAEIFEAVPGRIRKVPTLALPAGDVALSKRELPVAGTITIVKG